MSERRAIAAANVAIVAGLAYSADPAAAVNCDAYCAKSCSLAHGTNHEMCMQRCLPNCERKNKK
jgi:hypothetical protein